MFSVEFRKKIPNEKGYICLNYTEVSLNKVTYLFVLAIIIFCSGCKKWPWQDCEKGIGDVFEDRRSFTNFTSFTLDIPAELFLHPDTTRRRSEVVIIAQNNVAEQIEVINNDGAISVGFDGCFREHKEIQFHLYFNKLERLIINSPAKVFSSKALYGKKFNLVLNESASCNAFYFLDELIVDFRGAANITSNGYAHTHRVNFNSPSTYDASNLITDTTYVDMQANGTLKCYAAGLLDIQMSNGTIEYNGEDTLNITDRITGGVLVDKRDTL